LDAAASAIAPPAPAIAAPPATSGTFALLAALPTVWPTPPTALRTASAGLEPLLEPFELGDFAFEPDDLERDDFGFAAFLAAFGFAVLVFADFGFAALAFAFDCDFGFDDFDLLDDPALFGADRFLALVSAISLSPRWCP
jgi:hypothetical protein